MPLYAGRKLCMGAVEPRVTVEVVYALPGEQIVLYVELPRDSTIREAIERSGISRRFPEIDNLVGKVGVFGKHRTPDTLIKEGDRVEIYRQLPANPKDARHTRLRRRGRTSAG